MLRLILLNDPWLLARDVVVDTVDLSGMIFYSFLNLPRDQKTPDRFSSPRRPPSLEQIAGEHPNPLGAAEPVMRGSTSPCERSTSRKSTDQDSLLRA